MEAYLFHCLIISHIHTEVLVGAFFGTGEEATAQRRKTKKDINN
jgi:hypothetical protein